MALLDINRSAQSDAVSASISRAVYGLVSSFIAWNDERVTRKSLSRLSARELDDIGLCRGDIDLIAARGRATI